MDFWINQEGLFIFIFSNSCNEFASYILIFIFLIKKFGIEFSKFLVIKHLILFEYLPKFIIIFIYLFVLNILIMKEYNIFLILQLK